ncbi:CLUMA_CG000202, isoform A [Clunio marinus]|uniref:CLUMA_CG000202, isoform A n=1 Tax=Clunio marinus TaxID=568069 RepID=A0A1J1HED4_9DIPT|nr:CLUMA_CG000202, isoform A [Clunio marinus]
MKEWIKITLILCSFGFFREMRPNEPFVTEFLSNGVWRNVTSEQVNREIYPFGTYMYLAQLCLVFLVTDILRYKPIIIVSAVVALIMWSLLLWTSSLLALYFVQVCYGFFMAAEIAYFTYMYAKVEKNKYQKVTGHARASLLSGRFIASVIAQILVSFELMNIRELNYISLGAQMISLVIAICLPSVGISIYMWSYDTNKTMEKDNTNMTEALKDLNSLQQSVFESTEIKPTFSWTRAKNLLWEHFIQAYSSKTVLVWSIWWALAMAGFLIIQSYVQLLWQEIDPKQENFFNGAVEAALTLLGAISCLIAGFIPSDIFEKFDLWILSLCCFVEGIMIVISSITSSVWVAYVMYILFGILYMFMITLASATVAKNLVEDSFALIFGINTLLALVIQTIMTIVIISESGLELSPRNQFLVFGSYFVVLSAIFLIASFLKRGLSAFRMTLCRYRKNTKALKFLLLVAFICVITIVLRWNIAVFLIIIVCVGSFMILAYIIHDNESKIKVQTLVTSLLQVDISYNKRKPPDDVNQGEIKVTAELDAAIESFFKKIIETFLQSWYTELCQDEAFILSVKIEIAEALKKLALRLNNIDYSLMISTKLLPVVYSHMNLFKELTHNANLEEEQIIELYRGNEHLIHKATLNRNSEITYLRSFSKYFQPFLISRNHLECDILLNLLREILTHAVLLPMMDAIADPAIINSLVILATNPKIHGKVQVKKSGKEVVLLENFVKKFEMNLKSENDDEEEEEFYIAGNFFTDQEKLYSFMQHLKNKSNNDIDLLKFYLDVEHLNVELGKYDVICDPIKLSELQLKSVKLLELYQNKLIDDSEPKPSDLFKAHDLARRKLESKWKKGFSRSAEYFPLIYGDRDDTTKTYEAAKGFDINDSSMPHQKLSTKLRSVMSIRGGTVEGLEATEIPIWDALDHPLEPSSYYNSVAIKLRKERGQDLETFMQAFFHSIEQEADIGEDVALIQTREEENNRKRKIIPNRLKNVQLYKNLFNITKSFGGYIGQDYCDVKKLKTSTQSAITFLVSILNINDIIVRIVRGFFSLLPDSDFIIIELVRKLLHKIINQTILAKLIDELKEKIFDSNPTVDPTDVELNKQRHLAMVQVSKVNKNLGNILCLLQYPLLNKQLAYCLIDVVIAEIFPELNLDTKD